MNRESKPVPNDEVLKHAHEHDGSRATVDDHRHTPIVVERASEPHTHVADDRDHRAVPDAQTHAHGEHVHSHAHGAVPHTHESHVGQPSHHAAPTPHTRDAHPADQAPAPHTAHAAHPDGDMLFPSEESNGYRSRWEAIQTGFVDEPRAAVEQADALVAQITSRLTEVFTRERQNLEQHWARGESASTEDLRIALKRYRAFFDRLLSL